jgi:hypothetical protein
MKAHCVREVTTRAEVHPEIVVAATEAQIAVHWKEEDYLVDPEIADSQQQKEAKHRAPLHVRQCSGSGHTCTEPAVFAVSCASTSGFFYLYLFACLRFGFEFVISNPGRNHA